MSNLSISSSGIGFFGLLAIVFIVLKLTNFITWSWVCVLSPLWGGFVILLCIMFIFIIIFTINWSFNSLKRK